MFAIEKHSSLFSWIAIASKKKLYNICTRCVQNSAATFSLMTFGRMTFSITALSIMALSISITIKNSTLRIKTLNAYAECHYAVTIKSNKSA
jgi:hypothetical protein